MIKLAALAACCILVATPGKHKDAIAKPPAAIPYMVTCVDAAGKVYFLDEHGLLGASRTSTTITLVFVDTAGKKHFLTLVRDPHQKIPDTCSINFTKGSV